MNLGMRQNPTNGPPLMDDLWKMTDGLQTIAADQSDDLYAAPKLSGWERL